MNILGTATTNFTTKADLAGTLVPPILHRRRLVRIFTSEDALRIAAKEYDANPTGAIETYGPIADWNVSALIRGEGFYGPPSVKVAAHSTGHYPLDFSPDWICEREGECILTNSATGDKYHYTLPAGRITSIEDFFQASLAAQYGTQGLRLGSKPQTRQLLWQPYEHLFASAVLELVIRDNWLDYTGFACLLGILVCYSTLAVFGETSRCSNILRGTTSNQ